MLDTLRWADRQLLHQRPDLAAASVYVHFQSDLQQLDIVESWGVLNDPATWRNVPSLISWSLAVLSGNSQAQQQAMQAAKPAAEAAAVLPAPAAADMPGGPHEGAIDSSNGNGSSAIAAPCACCSEDSSQSGANGTSIKDSSWPAPSLGSQQPAAAAAAVPVTVGRQSSTTKVGVM